MGSGCVQHKLSILYIHIVQDWEAQGHTHDTVSWLNLIQLLSVIILHNSTCKAAKSLTAASCIPPNSYPPQKHHGAVVVDMQEGDLVVLLAKYEEECIEEFNDFGEEVEPDDTSKLE